MNLILSLAAVALLAQKPGAHEHHHHEAPAVEAGAFSTHSLYHLKSKWKDQAGKRVVLGDLRGKVVVLSMIYSSCQSVCPLLAADVGRVYEQLPEAVRPGVQLVLVSFDPERDTPAKLASYAAARGLKGASWKLLTGDDDGVRDLAALLGMKYRPTGTGDFAHSNLITVLNREGVIVHRSEGVGQDVGPTVAAVVSAVGAAGQAR